MAGITIFGGVRLPRVSIKFIIQVDDVELSEELRKAAKYVVVGGATTLAVLYGCKFLKPLIKGVIDGVLGGDDDDPPEIRPGSLHVLVHCRTNERFLEVLSEYESEKIKERLVEEFAEFSFKVKGLKVKIENMEDVIKIREAISPCKSGTRTKMVQSHKEDHSVAAMERNFSSRIIVQGGVSRQISPGQKDKYKSGTKESARAGYAVLMEGGTAVEAVEKAVRVLEENEDFNAGCGSLLNNDRKVECDAMIMRGDTLNYGAVFCGTHFRNPVSLAKEIMDKSPHCVLSGDGALDFAQAQGFETCAPEDLISGEIKNRLDVSYEEYQRWVKYNYGGKPLQEHDTVSAVAMDKDGILACATSTGGIPGKLKGRVGDAPLIGCGGYANEEGSATIGGHGESIMKVTLARQVVYNMQNGQNAQQSAENALRDMETRVNGRGGIIAIDKHGNFGTAFNTSLMVWASIKDEIVTYGMENGAEPEVEQFVPVPRA